MTSHSGEVEGMGEEQREEQREEREINIQNKDILDQSSI